MVRTYDEENPSDYVVYIPQITSVQVVYMPLRLRVYKLVYMPLRLRAVSYTHLTLPTILRV